MALGKCSQAELGLVTFQPVPSRGVDIDQVGDVVVGELGEGLETGGTVDGANESHRPDGEYDGAHDETVDRGEPEGLTPIGSIKSAG